MRIPDDRLVRLIEDDGYAPNGEEVLPIGVLRLALDLQEARAEVKHLQGVVADFVLRSGTVVPVAPCPKKKRKR